MVSDETVTSIILAVVLLVCSGIAIASEVVMNVPLCDLECKAKAMSLEIKEF